LHHSSHPGTSLYAWGRNIREPRIFLSFYRKPSVSPTAPPLIWETSLTGESPQSDKISWLDDDQVSPQLRASPPRSNAIEFQWETPEFQLFDSAEPSPNQLSNLPSPSDQDGLVGQSIIGSSFKVPPSLDSPGSRMNYAVSFFFQNLVAMPRANDSLRGYLEILGPMYVKAKSNSLLHQATHALALASLSNGRKSPLLRLEARRLYGRALHQVGIAIQDPVAARSDEVLMSIMLFSLYEAITSTDDSRTVWTRHINGAVTLVKLRGEKQLQNETSLHLFRAVRASMVEFHEAPLVSKTNSSTAYGEYPTRQDDRRVSKSE
jgi:hypothetical protein